MAVKIHSMENLDSDDFAQEWISPCAIHLKFSNAVTPPNVMACVLLMLTPSLGAAVISSFFSSPTKDVLPPLS